MPLRTPGTVGINDRAAEVSGAQTKPCPSAVLAGIWSSLTAAERNCVLEHAAAWAGLADGTADHRIYSSYSGFFEEIGGTLYGDDPDYVPRESAFTLLDHVYTKLCRFEYESIDDELKEAFEDQSKSHKIRPAWRYYRALRGGYVRSGFTYPVEAINQVNPEVRFLGKPVWKGVQKDLAVLLSKVEKRLEGDGSLRQVMSGLKLNHWGGFVPRFQKNSKYLSKHAIGLAIDIEYPTNPHVKGTAARAIDAILDHLAARGTRVHGRIRQVFTDYGNICMADFDRLKGISDALVQFLAEWLPKWEDLQLMPSREADLMRMSAPRVEWQRLRECRDDLLRDEKTLKLVDTLVKAWGGVERARFYAKHGLISLDEALFRAMAAEGVESGIEWKRHKDVMHFELPQSLRKWAKQKGYTKPGA